MFTDSKAGGTYAELLGAARTGDANAAYELYRKLATCRRVPRDASGFEKYLDRIHRTEHADRVDGYPVIRPSDPHEARRAIEAAVTFATRAHEFRLSVPEERMDRAEIRQWLHQAADGGHLRARSAVLLQESSFGDPRLTPQTVDARTAEFLRSIDAAALSGHVESLLAMGNLYLGGRLVERNVVKSYAYSAAARLIKHGEDMDPQQWEKCNSKHPLAGFAHLAPEESTAAVSLRKEIVSRVQR